MNITLRNVPYRTAGAVLRVNAQTSACEAPHRPLARAEWVFPASAMRNLIQYIIVRDRAHLWLFVALRACCVLHLLFVSSRLKLSKFLDATTAKLFSKAFHAIAGRKMIISVFKPSHLPTGLFVLFCLIGSCTTGATAFLAPYILTRASLLPRPQSENTHYLLSVPLSNSHARLFSLIFHSLYSSHALVRASTRKTASRSASSSSLLPSSNSSAAHHSPLS